MEESNERTQNGALFSMTVVTGRIAIDMNAIDFDSFDSIMPDHSGGV